MYTLEEFVSNFADQFETTDPKEIAASTHYRTLPDWDSLAALSLIAMVNANYNVQLKGGDIRGATTVEDVYNLVVSKMDEKE